MLDGKNISFVREGRELFSNLAFSLNPSEILRIRGANGSGKSTLLRLIAGLLPLKSGQLFWKGERLSKNTVSLYQQTLLYGGHKLGLFPEIRVKDQLTLWHKFYPIPYHKLEEALEAWGLQNTLRQKISQLSQGQQKRLSLSRCSWLSRSLWILDEPEAGLDDVGRGYFETLMLSHLKMGGMIVHATHQGLEGVDKPFLKTHEIVL